MQNTTSSRVERIAQHFRDHPNTWIDGLALADIGGRYAWRSRVSECRRPPFDLDIRNRQRTVKRIDGTTFTVSEYGYFVLLETGINKETTDGRGAAQDVRASHAAM